MADVSVLDVLLYEEPIGTLIGLPGDRTIFAFNDTYIEDENRHVPGLYLRSAQRRQPNRIFGPGTQSNHGVFECRCHSESIGSVRRVSSTNIRHEPSLHG
jgi:hypothetical protein